MVRRRSSWALSTVVLALLLCPWRGAAQTVTVNRAVTAPHLSGQRSGSWSHTVSGTQRYLLVGLAGWDNSSTLSSVQVRYNNVLMTSLGGTDGAGKNKARFWGLVAPATGTHTVSVANIPQGFAELGGGSISFVNVHQTMPTGALVTELDGDASVTLPVLTGDVGVDIFYSGQGPARPVMVAPGTARVAGSCCGIKWFMMGTAPGSGMVTLRWQDPDGPADFAQTAMVLKRASPPPTGPITVEWTYAGTEGDVFQMERCTVPCGPMAPVASLDIDDRQWIDSAVSPTTQYCYRMAVSTAGVLAPYSNTMCSP